ncbi:hypothetical protein N0B44_33345 [Roseibacterium beibuensis]|uniref:Uncharacterized protein n=1 Tax=[Roseibacterium] beibuensis TaxID=1193142 RepID=A0ABP9LPJ6_9RHOB|nr:hypothetical protein [Roseibacterium beibuensis]MCS6627800.1 hypothetical protein [Roseibacterium beibuensis]
MFLYILREFTRAEDDSHSPAKKKLSSSGNEDIKWDEVLSGSGDLVLQLTAARGFRPDLIIGLCGGGLIVADVLCKKTRTHSMYFSVGEQTFAQGKFAILWPRIES